MGGYFFLSKAVDNPLHSNSYVFNASLLASLSSLLLGYDIGVTSGALLFLTEDFGLSTVQQEVFVGILNLVALVGSLASGRLADIFGRRGAMASASVIFFVGSLLMAVAGNYTVLMIGRVITGIGVGFGMVLPPLYIAEISPPLPRGGLVTFGEIFINVGILLGFFASFVLGLSLPSNESWRAMLGLGILPAVLLLVGVFIMPESPRWLVMHGRVGEAEDILKKSSTIQGEAETRLLEILQAAGMADVSREKGSKEGDSPDSWSSGGNSRSSSVVAPMEGAGGMGVWKEILFPTQAVRRMLVVAIGISFLQQATGIDAVVYYSPIMFRQAGITGKLALLGATLVVGAIKVSFVFASMVMLDRFGRRVLLAVSCMGMFLSLLVQGIGLLLIDRATRDGLPLPTSDTGTLAVQAAVAITANCFFVAFFSIGIGPINWLMISEVFPLRLRAQGIAIGTAVNRIISGAFAMSFLSLGEALGPSGPVFIFSCFGLVAFLFCHFYVPETKGLSLETLVRLFEHSDYVQRSIMQGRQVEMEGEGEEDERGGGLSMTALSNQDSLRSS